MHFQIIGELSDVETIAIGSAIRELRRLRKIYGAARWKKKKGVGRVRFADGTICVVEIHWYEAHGKGAREYKIKRILE